MQTHHDLNGKAILPGAIVQFHNIHGKLKAGKVTVILPTCLKVLTKFAYYVDGKEVSGEGEFPVVPSDCEVVDATAY